MPYEMMVGLLVGDERGYRRYREAIAPLLERHGGGFRYDFSVAETLKSEAAHPINRVFVISFRDPRSKDAFFADPEYAGIRARFFEGSVQGTTIIAEYPR